jgi:hypothetical protein
VAVIGVKKSSPAQDHDRENDARHELPHKPPLS